MNIPGAVKSFVEAMHPDVSYRFLNLVNYISDGNIAASPIEENRYVVVVNETFIVLDNQQDSEGNLENCIVVVKRLPVEHISALQFKPNEPHYL